MNRTKFVLFCLSIPRQIGGPMRFHAVQSVDPDRCSLTSGVNCGTSIILMVPMIAEPHIINPAGHVLELRTKQIRSKIRTAFAVALWLYAPVLVVGLGAAAMVLASSRLDLQEVAEEGIIVRVDLNLQQMGLFRAGCRRWLWALAVPMANFPATLALRTLLELGNGEFVYVPGRIGPDRSR